MTDDAATREWTPGRIGTIAVGLLLLLAWGGIGLTDWLGLLAGHPWIAATVNGWALTGIGSGGCALAAAAAAGWTVRTIRRQLAGLRADLERIRHADYARADMLWRERETALQARHRDALGQAAVMAEQQMAAMGGLATEVAALRAELADALAALAERERLITAAYDLGRAEGASGTVVARINRHG